MKKGVSSVVLRKLLGGNGGDTSGQAAPPPLHVSVRNSVVLLATRVFKGIRASRVVEWLTWCCYAPVIKRRALVECSRLPSLALWW